MKTASIHKLVVPVLAAIMAIAIPQMVFAAGTASNTSISNRATVNYEVGGVGQTLIESSPTGNSTPGATNGTDTIFVVDNVVNLTVATTDGTYVSVVPAATAQITTFTVTNTGNTIQDFGLAASHSADPFGGTDNFNATNVNVYVESGATAGYQAAQDTAIYIDELASDATRTVYIVVDIPAGRATDDISALALTATARVGGAVGSLGGALTQTPGGDTAGVDIVFGDVAGDVDADRNADHSDRSAYEVTAAALTVTKTSAVYSDPFNGTTNPKAIPGAVITYTVTIANAAGGSNATNVAITDDLSAEIGAGRIAFATQFVGNAPPCAAGQGIVVNGTCNTNVSGDDDADWNATTANTVTVSGLTINAGSSAVISYQVVIQ